MTQVQITWKKEVPTTETNETTEISLTITGWIHPYVPPKLTGAWEDCSPAEGGYAEINEILLADGSPWEGELTEQEGEEVINLLFEIGQDKYHHINNL